MAPMSVTGLTAGAETSFAMPKSRTLTNSPSLRLRGAWSAATTKTFVGLDVAMHDAETVRFVENLGDLIDDDARFERSQPPAAHEKARQRLAVEALHDQVRRAVLGDAVVEGPARRGGCRAATTRATSR